MARSRIIDRGSLGKGMRENIDWFDRMARRAASEAAARATEKSRARFISKLGNETTSGRRGPRPTVAPRPGRPTTQGAFASHIEWALVGDGHRVSAQAGKLQRAAPYWLVLEIGTGSSAKVATGGLGQLRGGQGRNAPREAGNVSVKSQVGRRLPRSLHWSGTTGTDQLIPGPSMKPLTIKEEIKGKHYLREGGNAGFRRYEAELDRAWRSRASFGHHPKP